MNITNINVGTTSNDGTGDNLRTAGIIINNNFQTIAGELTQLMNASASLVLGETSNTAYRGDRGAIAYNHSQVTHDKALVGLGNVDNTSDANKPISNATQIALNGKVNTNQTINGQALTGNITLNTTSISDSTDRRYVNDSQLAIINNSGNHTALSNLNWTSSGHIGTGSTVAGFNSTGASEFLTVSGSGSVVLSSNASTTNLNLTTPILGTPQSGNLTNCNGTATNLIAGNISGGVVAVANGGTGVTTSKPIAQVVYNSTSAVATGTTLLPFDDTIPLNTEGTQFLTASITPKNANSTLEITATLFLANSGTAPATLTAALFQDSTANALTAAASVFPAANAMIEITIPVYTMTAGTTSATTFKVRAGANTAGTTTLNGIGGARYLGGVLYSTIKITEYYP